MNVYHFVLSFNQVLETKIHNQTAENLKHKNQRKYEKLSTEIKKTMRNYNFLLNIF